MTERRDFDRLTRAWLDLMPDQAPDRSIAAVLQTIERMPQKRPPLLVLRRFQPVNRFSYAAIAAALAVVLVGGGYLLTRSSTPNVGASPSPSLAPTATPGPSASLPTAAPDQQTFGDWVADAAPIAGLPAQGPRIQLSINWGPEAWVLTGYSGGVQAVTSYTAPAPDGQIRFVSDLQPTGCHAGDIGDYRWSRSADGVFLTLELIADACPLRATTLARTWVHTLSAVTSGGTGVLPVMNIQATLPARKFGLSGADFTGDVTTFDSTPFIGFLLDQDPVGFAKPCSDTDHTTLPARASTAAVVDYLKKIPGYTSTSANATIDGNPAVHLTLSPKLGSTCTSTEVQLFSTPDLSQSWTTGTDVVLSFWVTQHGSHTWLFWYRGTTVSEQDEATVISSIHFITQLPTP